MTNLFQKAKRVRNFPLLSVRVLQELMPGGFLSASNHLKKQRLIKEIQMEKKFEIFVETGTNEGAMIEAIKTCFNQIYSIELDIELFHKAQSRFASETHIHIFQGDSGTVLQKTLKSITTPALFWLDAHYSGGVTAKAESETPILKELDLVFAHPVKDHIVVIDDAWSFGTIKDYPSLSELKKFVKRKSPLTTVSVTKGMLVLR
jgi:hypothetical protein